jgi:hypothetical protein
MKKIAECNKIMRNLSLAMVARGYLFSERKVFVMTSIKEFLAEMTAEGEKATGGGAGIVGRVLIQLGLHRFVKDHDFWQFWLVTPEKSEVVRKTAELQERLNQAGSTEKPNFGLRVTIFSDVLGHAPYKKNLDEFIPSWQKEAYGLLAQHVIDANLPIGKEFWGHVQMKANPFAVAKGEAGKTDKDQNDVPRFPTIRVPVKMFTDRAEAQTFVNANGQVTSRPFSPTAKANYPDLSILETQGDDIAVWLNRAQQGTPYNNDATNFPLPTPLTPPNVKKYIANIFLVEPEDVDFFLPF